MLLHSCKNTATFRSADIYSDSSLASLSDESSEDSSDSSEVSSVDSPSAPPFAGPTFSPIAKRLATSFIRILHSSPFFAPATKTIKFSIFVIPSPFAPTSVILTSCSSPIFIGLGLSKSSFLRNPPPPPPLPKPPPQPPPLPKPPPPRPPPLLSLCSYILIHLVF